MDKDSRALRLRTNLYRMYQGQLTFLLGAVGVSLSLPLFALLRPLATALDGLGLLLALVGTIVYLAGLILVCSAHPDFGNALVVVVIRFLVGLFDSFLLMDLIGAVLEAVAVALVLQAADACLKEWGCFELRERSRRAARANVISCAVYLAAALVIRFVPSPGVLALAGLVSVAVSIWAIVRYMGYLKGSSRVF